MGKENELLEAARIGNLNVLEKLLAVKQKNVLSQALGFRRNVSVNCHDRSGYTPLHHAVLNGHSRAVQCLLKYEAIPTVPDNRGNTPMHLAAWTGNVAILISLFMKGVNRVQVNEQNNDQDSHLHFAAQYGHKNVVSVLLQNGANPDVLNKKSESPLDLACQYGRLEVVEILLKHRLDLLDKIPPDRSLLHLSARNGHHLVVKKLLQSGCDVNKRLKNGTPLHEAALFGKVDVVRILLECEQKVDTSTKDNLKETALQKVQGHSSKIAQDIVMLILAYNRGDALPPTNNFVVSISQSSSDGDDMEPPSVYDNLPPQTGTTSTLPLANRKQRDHNRSYEPVQLRQDRRNRTDDYMNISIGDKSRTPPRKPARVSIGHLLEQLNENGLTENSGQNNPSTSESFTNTASMLEIRQPIQLAQRTPSSINAEPTGPLDVLDDREYDVGDYAMLRPDAKLQQRPSPSPRPSKVFENDVGVELKSNCSSDSQSTGADPDSLYEELAHATTGPNKRALSTSRRAAPIAAIDSDPEGEMEVYELLSDAVSVLKPVPAPRKSPSRKNPSSMGASRKNTSSTGASRKNPSSTGASRKNPSSTGASRKNTSSTGPSCTGLSVKIDPVSSHHCEAIASNASTPSEEFSPLPRESGATPTLTTPSHPPPSPHTAMLGIQARLLEHKTLDSSLGEDDELSCSCDELPADLDCSPSSAPEDLLPQAKQNINHITFKSIAEESAFSPLTSVTIKNTYENTSIQDIKDTSTQDRMVIDHSGVPTSSTQDRMVIDHSGVPTSSTQDRMVIEKSRLYVQRSSRSDAGHHFKPVPQERTSIPLKLDRLRNENGISIVDCNRGSATVPSLTVEHVPSLTVEHVEKFNAVSSSPTKRVLAAKKSEDTKTDSSGESDVLRPDEADPFAGNLLQPS